MGTVDAFHAAPGGSAGGTSGGIVQALLGSSLAWVGVALVTALLVGASRLAVTAVRRVRGGMLPLVLHDESGNGNNLVPLLAASLVDGSSQRIVAPGTSSADGVEASTTFSEPPHVALLAAFLRLIRPPAPAYHIHLAHAYVPASSRAQATVTVRIVREPKKQVIVAETVTATGRASLLEKVACLCLVHVRNQPEMRRRVPRWDRWGDDPRGYLHYRRAVAQQEKLLAASPMGQDPSSLPAPDIQAVHDELVEASRFALSNLTLRLTAAAAHELFEPAGAPGRSAAVIKMYQRCLALWPEHIESAYRLAVVCSRQRETGQREWADLQLSHVLPQRLRIRALLWRYLRTWRPGGANIGERRYWTSWLTPLPFPPARRSRRRNFVAAVRIAQACQDMDSLINGEPAGPSRGGGPPPPPREWVGKLFDRVAGEALAYGRRRGLARLLHKDHKKGGRHDQARHPQFNVLRKQAEYAGAPKHPAANWHLHYNAACFLGLAMSLPPDAVPTDFSPVEWREDCARAAVHQLLLSLRAPETGLSKQWASRDGDLRVLWEFDRERNWGWADFFGVPPHVPTPEGQGGLVPVQGSGSGAADPGGHSAAQQSAI